MKQKAQRAAKIGVMKPTTPPVQQAVTDEPKQEPSPVKPTKKHPGEEGKIDANFVFEQNYAIIPDESVFDDSPYDQPLKRMYHAIIGNKKALMLVLEFIVLTEFDLAIEQHGHGYVQSQYGEDVHTLADIITQLLPIFSQEDRTWWEDIKQAVAKQKAIWNSYSYIEQEKRAATGQIEVTSLDDYIVTLYEAFSKNCKQTGFGISLTEVTCRGCGYKSWTG